MPNADKQYETLQKLIQANVLTSHRVTSPLLVGIRDSGGGGLGNNAQEMTEAFDLYLNSVVIGYQKQILKTLSKILSINDIDLPLSFVQAKPVSNKFTIDDMRAVMTQAEIRAELGLPELEESEETSDEEEVSLSEVNKDLQDFINLGEELNEDEWELYSDTEVQDELEDFNFENELHDLTRIELASTGTAFPNAKSGQDQTSKQTNYKDDLYRVRYVYTGPGGERAFCSAMKSANKAYRKEDIIRMGTQAVNPGFGPGGSDTYSIWKWKGGVNCYHAWYRRVYVTKKGDKPSNLDDIISSTEAKSRGVSLPRNAQQVSVAPINMPNQGRKN